MHAGSGPVHRSLVGVALVAALLAACSATEDGAAEAEVRGVTIDRTDVEADASTEDAGDGRGSAGDIDADEPQDGTIEDDAPGGIGALVLLRSGPLAVGTVWLAAAGQWVGLDAQTFDLDLDDAPTPVHLDVMLEPAGDTAVIEGCLLRFVAPDDATFEAVGIASIEVVIEDAAGVQIREPLDPVDLEVVLAPGQSVNLDVAHEADEGIDVDASDAVRVHCEGRFDRA